MGLKPSKVAVKADKGRGKREDQVVNILKSKREEWEKKMREEWQRKVREGLQAQQLLSVDAAAATEKMLENLLAMVAGVWTDDNNMQLEATTWFRKLLSIEHCPPIEDQVIQAGVVPRFVKFLAREDFPKLQLEAAWALANLAAGTSDNTKVVIDHGAVPLFVKLLGSPSDDVCTQAMWALGNIAGDSPKCRDLVLSHGALLPLLAKILNKHAKLSMLRAATWSLINFCRGQPQPSFDQVKPALPALARLILLNDEEVLANACWALYYLSDNTNDKIQAVVEAGVCGRLVELLHHPSSSVLIPALRTVGLIASGDDMHTQYYRPLILYRESSDVMRLLRFLVKEGCIKPMCDLLVCADSRVGIVTLEGLDNILKVWEAEKKLDIYEAEKDYPKMIDDAKGLEKLQYLQCHHNNNICEKAVSIVEKYWWGPMKQGLSKMGVVSVST